MATTTEMVQAAIEAGMTESGAGVDWIKQKFGVQVRSQNFGRIRTNLQKQRAGRRKQARVLGEGYQRITKARGRNLMEMALVFQKYVDSHGIEVVREVLDMIEGFQKR
jgi:hypothetical protein